MNGWGWGGTMRIFKNIGKNILIILGKNILIKSELIGKTYSHIFCKYRNSFKKKGGGIIRISPISLQLPVGRF